MMALQYIHRGGFSSKVSIKNLSVPARKLSMKLPLRDTEGTRKFILMSTVLANVSIFIGWQFADSDYQIRRFMTENFTVSSSGVFDNHRFHTLLTSCYSHQDIAHVLFNMAAFYSFGSSAIAVLGSGRFIALYLTGGMLSSLCQAAWPYIIPRSWPASRNYSRYSVGLGASGAVNAVVMFNILSIPASTVMLWGVLPIPGILFGMGYVAFDAYSLYDGGGQMGNAAHLAGAAVGALLWLWRKRRVVRFRR